MISIIGFGGDATQARDLLGQVYEYSYSPFASAEGKKGGYSSTPRPTLVSKPWSRCSAAPHGKVYDPCCGSRGMFILVVGKFIEARRQTR